MLRIIGFLAAAAIASLPAAKAQNAGQELLEDLQINPNVPIISDVAFPSLATPPLTIAGQLRVPATGADKYPAVVIVHGSAGIDSRNKFYADALNLAGIATLEIDMWAARGWLGGVTGRPAGVPETLPDAYGALKFLSTLPHIDASRIGITGFSWGGVVTMLTATAPYTNQYTGGTLKFVAHAANYPVCWVYNHVPGYEFSAFTGAPVFIQAGQLDAYDLPTSCPDLVASLTPDDRSFISAVVYPDATHAWDRLQPAETVTDPYSHLGQGGQVEFVPNPPVAAVSRAATVAFFERVFGLQPTPPSRAGD
ncbi:MAG: dienelactone hydrolase family protein [Acetobacteraceae bacterium]|nr:dienelactone hydrolase family protein [Acetobacteraceae bacterium]